MSPKIIAIVLECMILGGIFMYACWDVERLGGPVGPRRTIFTIWWCIFTASAFVIGANYVLGSFR